MDEVSLKNKKAWEYRATVEKQLETEYAVIFAVTKEV